MRSPPLPVAAAAILLVLESLTGFQFLWDYLFPGVEGPPWFIVYPGYVVGVAGLVIAVGLWQLKRWSFWATIVDAVLSFLLAAPGLVAAPTELRGAITATAVLAVVIVALVLLPSSRRALRR